MNHTVKVLSSSGKEVGSRALPEKLFGGKPNRHLLHQVVRWQGAKARAGTHSVKTRAEMTGGGVKPWKQKGTGRARAGSNTSPLWVGGGVAHGPKPRSYSFRLNSRERRNALLSAVTVRSGEGRLIVVDDFDLKEPKTKQAAVVLARIGIPAGSKVLTVIPKGEAVLSKSLRNIKGVTVSSVEGLNVRDVLGSRFLVFVGSALESTVERLSV